MTYDTPCLVQSLPILSRERSVCIERMKFQEGYLCDDLFCVTTTYVFCVTGFDRRHLVQVAAKRD